MENKQGGHFVYGFMKDMGLSNKELMVYSFIYSFTQKGCGFYYGGQKYMAESLGLSMRTLQRVLRKLLDKGLIEKYHNKTRCGLRSTPRKIVKEKIPVVSGYSASDEYDGRYARENGEVIKLNAEAVRKFNENEQRFYNGITPKHTLIRYGREGLVALTKPQYDALRTILKTENLQDYFLRYELMLKENIQTGKKPPHSAYKTLKAWIESDMEVDG